MTDKIVLVPDIGGSEGAEVVDLLVEVGEQISEEQSILVLESDKASMEIPSPYAGIVKEINVKVGDELSEGAQVLVMTLSGDVAGDAADDGDTADSAPDVVDDASQEVAVQETSEQAAPAASSGEEIVHEVVVPDTGSDGAMDLTEVCVAEGDSVEEGDSLVVLESDKASMEVPSPVSGVIRSIAVSAGASVKDGDALMSIKGAGAMQAPVESSTDKANDKLAAPAKAAVENSVAPKAAAPSSSDKHDDLVYAGPAVRKLAREFGVPLAQVKGTGPRGRVMKEDLHAFVSDMVEGKAQAMAAGSGIPAVPAVDFSAFGDVSEAPLSRVARLTAENMQRSWLNVPHVTQFDDADITDMEAFRKGLKAEAERRGTKLTPMAFVVLATARVLRQHPLFLSSLSADGQSLITKDYCHIGMAVDTPAGLVVPVIRDADKKTLWELAVEILELAGKARDRKLRPDDMQGGCFTISSLGSLGGRGFTPIINTPEVGILAVSKASQQPVWDGNQFSPRNMLPLALSYDHRVINGGDAGRFMTQLVTTLGDIRHLLL